MLARNSKYVAFDIGKVLCEVNLELFADFLYKNKYIDSIYCGIDFCEDIAYSVDVGATTVRKELIKMGVKRADLAKLEQLWTQLIKPIVGTTGMLEELIRKEYRIALLSNIGKEHGEIIRSQFPEVYKKCIQHFSYEVGVRKPAKLYYQSFLWENPDFRGCMYFDDRIENVFAGLTAGFDSQHFDITAENDLKRNAAELRAIVLDIPREV